MRPDKITGFIKDGTSKITGFLEAFRDFALRGNVIDMAVGIIVGSSFNDIVSSLVRDIIMPPIGLLMAGKSFADFAITLRDTVRNEAGEIIKERVTLNIGAFVQQIIDFTIESLSLFIVIQIVYKLRRKMQQREKEAEKKQQETQEQLLRDIRYELRKQSSREPTSTSS